MPNSASDIEKRKVLLDYAKQLTTLSTGSIVLVGAFAEKVFPEATCKELLAIALTAFVVSVIGAIVAHTIWLIEFPPRSKERSWERSVGGFGLWAAWGGFLVGIISFAIFAAKNLLQ
jgi:hypothetical protein